MIKSSGVEQQSFSEASLSELISKIQFDVAVNLKKDINEISNLYNEMSLNEYSEENYKKDYYKYKKSKKNFINNLQSIKDSLNFLSETIVDTNKLQKKKQDCIDLTVEFLNKYEETTQEKINEIDKKTKLWEEKIKNKYNNNNNNNNNLNNNSNDMSESLIPPDENDDDEKNENKIQVQAILNKNEFLDQKEKDIKDINKTSQLINKLSEDMKQKVYEGALKLNSIEENVEHMAENVDKAEKEISKAKEIEKGNRKKLCCIFWFVIFVILAICGLVIIIIRG
jgi:hypothetical protein